jgi:hypothetical protein
VLAGGYLSWRDPTSKHWFQLRMFPDPLSKKSPHVIDLNTETVFEELVQATNLRAAVDRVTPRPPIARGIARAPGVTARTAQATGQTAQLERARALRAQIEMLKHDDQR